MWKRTADRRRVLYIAERLLTAIFWGTVLLAFSSPALAMMTALCSLIHEGGHLLAFLAVGRKPSGIRTRYDGIRLLPTGILSYRDEILVAAAGPCINLACAAVCLFCVPLTKEPFFEQFALLHLLTAGSNLIPITGYDGGRILFDAIAGTWDDALAEQVCHLVSLSLTGMMCFLSLYTIRDFDAGYWLFGVFLLSLISQIRRHLPSAPHVRTFCEKT